MTQTMNPAAPTVVYRLSRDATEQTCPLCGADFTTTFGLWPYLEGSATPLCRADHGDDVDMQYGAPCDSRFVIPGLGAATLRAIAAADEALPVAERLRQVGLDEALPVADRDVLCRAAIDLAFCEADGTRIESLDPDLVLRTCDVAAAEMILSGIGDVV